MNLYEILGVPSDATADDIAKAYRAKAKKLHPDAGGEASAFAELAFAYEVLGDSERREKYDQAGKVGVEPDMVQSTIAGLAVQAFKQSNPVRWMLDQIDAQRSEHKRLKSLHEQELAALKKVSERFAASNEKTANTETRDFIAGVWAGQIEALETQLKVDEQDIQLGTKILAYMNGIRYEDPSKPNAYRGWGFASVDDCERFERLVAT